MTESLEDFGARARTWIAGHLPGADEPPVDSKELQNRIFDAGFAGIAFPTEYGGAGLTLDHQRVFYDTAAELARQVPTHPTYRVSIGMLGPTLLEHAHPEAKARFLPPLLRGDEVWMQLLSEPRGGSDMAGATTRIDRDGDTYVLNGAKMWSTRAHLSHYGLCLCRSNWDLPKHRGLSMIAVPLRKMPGVDIHQTRAADGTLGDFCEESFTDVRLPVANLIGEENDGWRVAQTLLFHERNAVGNIGYGYLNGAKTSSTSSLEVAVEELMATARSRSLKSLDPEVSAGLADVYIEALVWRLTSNRIAAGLRAGSHQGPWGSLSKLQQAVGHHHANRVALALYQADGVIWDGTDVRSDNAGTEWLSARAHTLAGGSNEMQRNTISERLLGLPRDPVSDRDLPFREVMRGAAG